MKRIIILSLAVILSLNIANVWAQNDSTNIKATETFITEQKEFSKIDGDSAYMNNDYLKAIDIYESILQQGEAAELYYNLGNSYYKQGEIAKAILNYERALLMQPNNSDIKANLEIARAKTIDKVVPIPEIFFITWFKALINKLSVDTWAKLGIICFVVFIVTLAMFLFAKQLKTKKISFIVGCICLIISVLSNIFAWQQKTDLIENKEAIILAPSVTARSTPSENGTSLFILHEGHKVEIKDNSMKEWKEIRLEDGKVGWIPTQSLELIYKSNY